MLVTIIQPQEKTNPFRDVILVDKIAKPSKIPLGMI